MEVLRSTPPDPFLSSSQSHSNWIASESDEYCSAAARNVEAGQKLVEPGFEYVCDFDDLKLFNKRKYEKCLGMTENHRGLK